MKILDNNRFMRLIDGKLIRENNGSIKILYLKHPSWIEPDNKEKGKGGINAVGRVIYNHITILEKRGYNIDLLYDSEVDIESLEKYDFVHCSFWFQCMRYIRLGIPYILNIHDNSPLLEQKNSSLYNAYKYVISHSLVTVAQTDQVKEKWDELAHKIVTVPVPIDTDRLTPDDTIEREDYVLCAAAVESIKGHKFLARACNELGFPLLIIGNPIDDDTVSELRGEINKSDGRIVWIEESVPFDELIGYYHKCRVFAMTTKMDVPGLVYLEALSCGANVVASEQGDYKSENPKIVRCGLDNDSIKNALQSAWEMPFGPEGRQYVIDKHHPENCVSLYEKLIYQGSWDKKYTIMDKSSSLYDINFTDDSKLELVFWCKPFDIDNDISIDFKVLVDGKFWWEDSSELPNRIMVGQPKSIANIPKEYEKVWYEIKLNGILTETGSIILENQDFIERSFHVDDFSFLDMSDG